ncbi:hypothetical protein JTE90_017247 [Oedothorax gibbosus]|uniref:Uncharacterized protein n=1 Tax=Oedothorax gibbosus TaxID=931172 RepID=A0AAV6VGF7_9ARAC|nr:hypothetical protein JTE90_017247 [Oedothorax gibbosus]
MSFGNNSFYSLNKGFPTPHVSKERVSHTTSFPVYLVVFPLLVGQSVCIALSEPIDAELGCSSEGAPTCSLPMQRRHLLLPQALPPRRHSWICG